jgi:tetratricopeptide (TPR) repeat protein
VLATRLARAPIALLVTSRTEGADAVQRLARASPDEPVVVELGELSADDTAMLVTGLLGGSASPSLVSGIETRTRGNPLFVQEVLASLRETDALVAAAQGWTLRRGHSLDEVPGTIERVLAARIDLLPRPAAGLLQTAAVIGREVRIPLLDEVSDLDPATVDELVSVLADRGFVHIRPDSGPQIRDLTHTVPPPTDSRRVQTRAVFHHALVVDVAYQRLLRRDRQRLHHAVLSAAERRYGGGEDMIGILAHHAYHAGIGTLALPYLTAAAERAAQLFANDEARTQWGRAIQLAGTEPATHTAMVRMKLELAGLETHVGNNETALALYDEARADHAGLDAWFGRARTLRALGRYDEVLELLDELESSEADLQAGDQGAIAHLRGLTLAVTGRTAEGIAELKRAVTILEPVDPRGHAYAMLELARYEQLLEMGPESVAHARQATAVFEEQQHLPGLATALRVLGGALGEAQTDPGDPAQTVEVEDLLRRALAVARQIGNAEEEGAGLINLGFMLQRADRLEEAVTCYTEALSAFEQCGIKGGIACAYCNLADVLQELDRPAEAADAANAGLAVAEQIGHVSWIAGARIGLANSALAVEDWEGAHAHASEALRVSQQAGLPDRAETANRSIYAAAHQMRTPPPEGSLGPPRGEN